MSARAVASRGAVQPWLPVGAPSAAGRKCRRQRRSAVSPRAAAPHSSAGDGGHELAHPQPQNLQEKRQQQHHQHHESRQHWPSPQDQPSFAPSWMQSQPADATMYVLTEREGVGRQLLCGPKGCRPLFADELPYYCSSGSTSSVVVDPTMAAVVAAASAAAAADAAHHHGHASSAFAMRHLSGPTWIEEQWGCCSAELMALTVSAALNLRLVDTFMMRRLRSSLPLTHPLITLPLKYAQRRAQQQRPIPGVRNGASSSTSDSLNHVYNLSSLQGARNGGNGGSSALPADGRPPVYAVNMNERGHTATSSEALYEDGGGGSYLPSSMQRHPSPHEQHSPRALSAASATALPVLGSAAAEGAPAASSSQPLEYCVPASRVLGSPAAAAAASASSGSGVSSEEFRAEGDLLGAYARMLWECYRDHERADALYQLALQCYDMSEGSSAAAISLMGDYTHFLFVSEDCFNG